MSNMDNFNFTILAAAFNVKFDLLLGGVCGMASVPSRSTDCSGYSK